MAGKEDSLPADDHAAGQGLRDHVDIEAVRAFIRANYDLPDLAPPPDVAEYLAHPSYDPPYLDRIGTTQAEAQRDLDHIESLRDELVSDLAAMDSQAASKGAIGVSRSARDAQALAHSAQDWLDAVAAEAPKLRDRSAANTLALGDAWRHNALIPAGVEAYRRHVEESSAELSARMFRLNARSAELDQRGITAVEPERMAVDSERMATAPLLANAQTLLDSLAVSTAISGMNHAFAGIASVMWDATSAHAHAAYQHRARARARRARWLVAREVLYFVASALASVWVADILSDTPIAGFLTFFAAELLLNTLDRWGISPIMTLHDSIREVDGLVEGVNAGAQLLTSVRIQENAMSAVAQLNNVSLTPVLGSLLVTLDAIQTIGPPDVDPDGQNLIRR